MTTKTVDEIEDWMVKHVAALLEVEASSVDVDTPFRTLGLDSIAAVDMSVELEDWLGRDLPPTIAYDHPTIAKLSAHLASLPSLESEAAE